MNIETTFGIDQFYRIRTCFIHDNRSLIFTSTPFPLVILRTSINVQPVAVANEILWQKRGGFCWRVDEYLNFPIRRTAAGNRNANINRLVKCGLVGICSGDGLAITTVTEVLENGRGIVGKINLFGIELKGGFAIKIIITKGIGCFSICLLYTSRCV